MAFNSEEKYNEGDHVIVNAANVSKVETTGGDDVYTLTASKILGEAEGEGLVSRETLGLLAKSEDQWLCEVHRAKSGVRKSCLKVMYSTSVHRQVVCGLFIHLWLTVSI